MVIGGGGLIGSHVVERLLRDPVAEVLVYDDFSRGRMANLEEALRDERVTFHPAGGDIRQTDILASAMEGSEVVFHLAALWLLQCHEYPRSAFDVNIAGTFNVLEACHQLGVRRMVFSSSASVYGDAVEVPMTEAHPFNNRNFYGATKIAGEAMCEAFHHRYGLSYAALRYMNVYGARQDYRGTYIAVIMRMLDRIDRGLPLQVEGDGSQTFDFVSVSDVAEANVAAATASPSGVYNIGSGHPTTILELAELLLEVTDADVGIEHLPARGETFVTHRIGSTEKAERELGFRASVGLREGLARVIAWRRDHLAEVAARRAEVGTSGR